MDEEMKTWACLKVLNLKMADPGEGFWVQACRSCKKSLVFASKLLWSAVKVFLLLQPLLRRTENSPCLKCQEKQELTNKPEDRVSSSGVTSSSTTATSLHDGPKLAPVGQPAVLTSHGLSSCAFLTVCWLLAFHWWAYLLSCKRLPAATLTITHLHCKCLCFVILKMCLQRLHFSVAWWSGTKSWEDHWCDATVVYDLRRRDPGWKLSGGIPNELSWEENPTRKDLSAEGKSEGFMYSEEKCGTINANSVTPQEWACAMLRLNASLANPWGRSLFQTAQYNSSRERTETPRMLIISQFLLPCEAENRKAMKLFPRNTKVMFSRAIKSWRR